MGKLAELHCHTWFSNRDGRFECLTAPESLLKAAKARGLSALAITDHNTLKGSRQAEKLSSKYGITIIPAMEVDTDGKGQILAYGIKQEIKPFRSAVEVIDEVHEQGGIAVVPHPFDFLRGMKNIDKVMGYADGIEVLNYGSVNNRRAKRYARKNGIKLQTGGSDAHAARLVGAVRVEFPQQCASAQDYVNCLKEAQFRIVRSRRHSTSLFWGGWNILHTRFWKYVPKRLQRRKVDLAWIRSGTA